MSLSNSRLSPLDEYRRLAPGSGLIGVLKPEWRTVSHWGMFYIPYDVEVFHFKDHGLNIGQRYVSEFTNKQGTILSIFNGVDMQDRAVHDESIIAKYLGFEPEEVTILTGAL